MPRARKHPNAPKRKYTRKKPIIAEVVPLSRLNISEEMREEALAAFKEIREHRALKAPSPVKMATIEGSCFRVSIEITDPRVLAERDHLMTALREVMGQLAIMVAIEHATEPAHE
jgi:hypothetical protein